MKRRLFSMPIHLVHVCTASTAHSRKTALDSYLCMCMSHKIVLANNFKHSTTVQYRILRMCRYLVVICT